MKHFTFRLPVKRHVYKFLSTKYGETIDAQMETDIGFVVLNTLASRLESKVCRGYNNQFADPYPSVITFNVPLHFFYLTKKEISVHTGILLNRYFENQFKQALHLHISYSSTTGWGLYKKAMESFCAMYNISLEEDISFDTLKKMESRYRKDHPIRPMNSPAPDPSSDTDTRTNRNNKYYSGRARFNDTVRFNSAPFGTAGHLPGGGASVRGSGPRDY